MGAVEVLLVPVEGPAQVVSVVPSHEVFCGLVGDSNTDTVFFADGGGMVKVAANGRARGLGVNVGATRLVEQVVPGFAKRGRVLGPAVFVGLGADGDPVSVSEGVVGLAGVLAGGVDR